MPKRSIFATYGLLAALVLIACVYVSHKDANSRLLAEESCRKDHLSAGSSSIYDEECDRRADYASRHLPRLYKLFTWPEGVTAWAILLTLLAIAEQTGDTSRSARATEKSVRLSADANSQWVELHLIDMYTVAPEGQIDKPEVITLKPRWSVLNPSQQPLTLHQVFVSVALKDGWHVSEFDFEEVIQPGESDELKILIVPIHLDDRETADYLSDGVEFPINLRARFSGVNGRVESQSWGDLYFFRKGKVERNPSLGKGPQREYVEAYQGHGTIVASDGELYEYPRSTPPWKRLRQKRR